jgi:hypothetical protein
MKTATTSADKISKKDLKREQELKDKSRAEELIVAYEELVREQEAQKQKLSDAIKPFQEEFDRQCAPLKTMHEPRLNGLKASIEAAEKELLEIGDRNKQFFAVDGNWKFENTFYLHIKKNTTPVFGEAFDLSKFVKKFQDYVSITFKIKELKALFLDGDAKQRKQMIDLGFDLDVEESIEIKESKRKEPKE